MTIFTTVGNLAHANLIRDNLNRFLTSDWFPAKVKKIGRYDITSLSTIIVHDQNKYFQIISSTMNESLFYGRPGSKKMHIKQLMDCNVFITRSQYSRYI